MLRVEKGGEYTAHRVRTGEADKGPWELIVVKEDGRAHREMTVFARNTPSGVVEGGLFKVKEILSAGPRRTKNPDGTWSSFEKTSIEAVVEPVEQSLEDLGSGDLEDGSGYDELLGLL